ncbi:DELLA protein SLR1-like [Oryza brachyantha]|uniref:DELLA protein SLR1-like n=1 Tax=Oryza brachyantha TaxID=4533 RepID=UPI001AD95439|nr:DELLA protein SLR1-like [Oryza brachyantha]
MAQFGGFGGGWSASAMDVAAAAAAAAALANSTTTNAAAAAAAAAAALANSTNGNGAAYHADPAAAAAAAAMYVSLTPGVTTVPARVLPSAVQIEAARRCYELEKMAVRSVNLLVTCAGAIQAGDYAAAAGSLSDAREIFVKMPTRTGIGRVLTHFADALAERLFPAFPQSVPPPLPPRAEERELFRGFYEAGPFLKFAHFTANQAILEAFEGCNSVHVIDFDLKEGVQWPSLIQALVVRPGGPPFLRITGIGPHAGGNRDELRDVGIRLAELAKSYNVPFAFRGIAADQLDGLRPWMFQVAPGEAVAVNSVLQLHRLLVDQDAATAAPIEAVLDWVASMNPKVFTVVEQEADHNKASLLERFTNSLFYYASMFDSLEAASRHAGGDGVGNQLAEAFLQGEIADIVSREGSSRVERHEPMPRWTERLQRAGLAQLPLGATGLWQAAMQVRDFCGAGFGVQENGGFLTLTWHNQKLYSASAWRAAACNKKMIAGAAAMEESQHSDQNAGEGSSGHGVFSQMMH